MTEPIKALRPQPGPQEVFLSCPADVALYGGAAGGGKSFALLLDPVRYLSNPQFGAIIFRRTTPQITNKGALWDQSWKIYNLSSLGGRAVTSPRHKWVFPSKATIEFSHMEHEKNKEDHQGAEYPIIYFDELTHFTRGQFVYMLSRNRSTCGIRPYIRSTCNPDSESWVADFIAWWIDQDTGYAIPERSGVIRYFVTYNDEFYWGDTKKELKDRFATLFGGRDEVQPLSFTFISANLSDNKILEGLDPGYRAKLMAMPEVERERLLRGNWKISAGDGIIKSDWIRYYKELPPVNYYVWSWDTAIKEGQENDFSAGQLWACCDSGYYLVRRFKFKKTYPDLKRVVWQAFQDQPSKEVLIEDKSSGSQLIQDFRRPIPEFVQPGKQTIPLPVIAMIPNGKSMAKTKTERVNFVSPCFEGGIVFAPDPTMPGNEWVKEVVLEWVKFPNVVHDDECFIAGTMIATTDGDIPIEKITTDHYVLTFSGPKRVLESRCTGIKSVVSNLGLTGTANHPVYQYTNGFQPMIDCFKESILRNNEWNLLRVTVLKWLSSIVLNTEEWAGVEIIISLNQKLTWVEKMQKGFMWLFGNIFQGKKSQKVFMSIIKMVIHLIICLKILLVYRLKNIQKSLKISTKKSVEVTWKSKDQKSTNGTKARQEEPGIHPMLRKLLKIASRDLMFACNVAKKELIKVLGQNKNTVPTFAATNSGSLKDFITLPPSVLSADWNLMESFQSIPQNGRKPVPDLVPENMEPVYNLKVEGDPTYFANGILVHNCDAMSQFLTRQLKKEHNTELGLPVLTNGTVDAYLTGELEEYQTSDPWSAVW